MKHLKTYENVQNMYIVVKSNRYDIPYYLLKIDYLSEDEIHYIEFGFYNQDDNISGKSLDSMYRHVYRSTGTLSTKEFPILYKTTWFKEAKEMLKGIIISSKYNI